MRLDHLLSKELKFVLFKIDKCESVYLAHCLVLSVLLTHLFYDHGGVAQLVEHLPCKQGVRSSTLLISTILEIRI